MDANAVYRDKLEFPMEDLAVELFGVGGECQCDDAELVTKAATKIRMLKEMLIATGFSKDLLEICMKN